MRKNTFKQLIKEKKPTLGMRVVIPWPRVMETVGLTGQYDYVEFASEYSPWDYELLENLARTYELFPGMSPMIKIGELERGALITRAVDAGFMNIKLADVRKAQDIRDAIAMIRSEAVGGLHGWTHGRNTINVAPKDWIEEMNDVGVICVIEKKSAYDQLDEILEIEGLDMLTLGPADMSISLGRPGTPGKYFQNPDIVVIERDIIKRCNAAGVGYRAHPNNPDEVREYLDMGVRNFSIGMDLDYIYHEAKKNGEQMRKLLSDVK